ncbi:MAG TPA: O-antigen ligase family protein [Kiritimatiellia bacterium]|nr:O-antigen ligase family protein [Kiritimatiellia bacterium]
MTRGSIQLERHETGLIGSLVALLAYAAWARGGTHVPLQWPLPLLALLVLIFTAFGAGRGWFKVLFKDAVFWLGAAFLTLIILQSVNAGRVLLYDPARGAWFYSRPPMPGLPSAISRSESLEMLRWFFPAWAVVLAIRANVLRRRALRLLYLLMAVNGGLLAVLGIAQFVSGATSIYGVYPLKTHFFAAFGYANHAGAYFNLMFALSAGLLIHDAKFFREPERRLRLMVLVPVTVLNFIAANLSLSRAGMIFSWGLAAFFGLYAMWWVGRLMTPAHRAYFLAGLAVLACSAYLVVGGLARDAIRRELSGQEYKTRSSLPLKGEWQMLRVASVRIWKDHPWVGIGGWGFRYMLSVYLEPSQWDGIRTGDANAHNDPLQFLVEFGAVGGVLMAGVVLSLLVPILRSGRWLDPLMLFPLAGAGVTALHSLIDLPFRSPAILMAWLLILAAMLRQLPPSARKQAGVAAEPGL